MTDPTVASPNRSEAKGRDLLDIVGPHDWAEVVGAAREQHLRSTQQPRLAPTRIEDAPSGVSLVLVPCIDAMRALFGPASTGQRRSRGGVFWQARGLRERGKLGIGLHDRAEAYAFADGARPDDDVLSYARHFPLRVQITRLQRLSVRRGETLDISADRDAWPDLSVGEKRYSIVLVNEVRLAPEARLVVRGDLCVLNFGEVGLWSDGGPPAPAAIELQGSAVLARSDARHVLDDEAAQGSAGVDGMRAASAPPPPPALFGPPKTPLPCPRAEAGGQGGAGGDGRQGQSGGPARLADVRIAALSGFPNRGLRISAGAARGGVGGMGGRGGCGGCGGDAGEGATPGPGGPGGRGGNGGRGGPGGLAANVFITAPGSQAAALALSSLVSRGGEPGPGGAGGFGGPGGNGAAGPASSGEPGARGAPGLPGRDRDGPRIFLFDGDNPEAPPIQTIQTRAR